MSRIKVVTVTVLTTLLVAIWLLVPMVALAFNPQPEPPGVSKLDAVVNVLEQVDQRLEHILSTTTVEDGKRTPAPDGLVGKLEAMANQLQVLDERVRDVLIDPGDDGRVLEALEDVRDSAQSIVFRAGEGFIDPGDDGRVFTALEAVGNSAQDIVNTAYEYLDPGF